MSRIIIITSKEQVFDPNHFEISIQKSKPEDKSTTIKKIILKDKNIIWEPLEKDDMIGVTYKGITQIISDNTEGEGSPTFTVTGEDDHDLTLYIKGGVNQGAESRTIENELDVNLKSFKLKQPLEIKLVPSTGDPTKDQSFWEVINNHKIDFKHYRNYIDDIMTFDLKKVVSTASSPHGDFSRSKKEPLIEYSHDEKRADTRRLPFNRTEAYSLLKYATEKYVEHVYKLSNYINDDSEKEKFDLGDYLGKDKITPYYNLIIAKIKEYFPKDLDCANGFLKGHTDTTVLELIWNYWTEEGMVNQTMIALARRFQNIKNGYNDPLANFALDPLRPLNNILWGYIQDSQHRLTSKRRNYEYTSEYDLCVTGAMKAGFNPADRRSKFLQSFHRLIYEATEYFVQADNTIIRPDGFKLLDALRDTHRILAEGAINQFCDLPTVARIETLMEQWILSRSEIREFLGGRTMVPYEEPWMDRVDSMKALQGWDNTSITFYRDLAVYGEKIILGIRHGNWTSVTRRDHATNWADAFRDAIQRYIQSYYTVTGVDLAAKNVNIHSEEKYLLPSMLIQRRLTRDKAFIRKP